MSKHRRTPSRRYIKKAAKAGGALATATAMTVSVAAPSANAAGVDYTQLITDNSNTLNNVLFINGNLGGTAASIWNPIANLIPGGLLPTFTAGADQFDLTSLTSLGDALSLILPTPVPDLSGVPGLLPNAAGLLQLGLLPGLAIVVPATGAVTLVTLVGANVVDGILGALGAIPLLEGVPTLNELIPGFTVTETIFDSSYNWPLLGLGPILGLQGSTSISNTFAQLPSLTGATLITDILSGLSYNGGNPLPPLVQATVNAILTPLNAVNTPSITAWIPAGQGNYGLPLGGSVGWLSTMPTLDIGPIPLVSDTDTVIAIPINAFGAVAPLGLASFGYTGTPGIVFPTATGVSTLGGNSLTSFSIPMLGVSMTNLNVLTASYIGTNGINWSNGTNIFTLTTPFGSLPLVWSLGSFNIGSSGFGFTLPSLFTVGLLPSFQIGTPPVQQSPDGLLPESVINLGLGIPTQTTDVLTQLGLPNPFTPVQAILNPVFNTLLAPIGSLITNNLNNIVGPLTNGLANIAQQVTALVAQLTGGGPPFNPSSTSTLAVATFAESSGPELTAARVGDHDDAKSSEPQGNTPDAVNTDVQESTQDPAPKDPAPKDPAPKKGPKLNVVTQTGNPTTDPVDGDDQDAAKGSDAQDQPTKPKESVDKVKDTATDGAQPADTADSTSASTAAAAS